jgi:hypothetical protein
MIGPSAFAFLEQEILSWSVIRLAGSFRAGA